MTCVDFFGVGSQVEEEIASGPHELESSFARTGPRSGRGTRPCTPIPRRGSVSNRLDQSTAQVGLCQLLRCTCSPMAQLLTASDGLAVQNCLEGRQAPLALWHACTDGRYPHVTFTLELTMLLSRSQV